MSQHRYEEDMELIQMVEGCIARQLSNQESLIELASKGKQISPKTYQRIKHRINKLNKEKLKNINWYGRSKYILESIELFDELQKNIRDKIKNSKDSWFILNATMCLAKLQKDVDNKLSILVLLEQVMIEFKMDLISRIKPQLSSRTSELFRQMTNGKYPSIELDDDYTIMINDNGQYHPIERFSGGETDLANLCLRIAISQELSQRIGGSRTQFIVLDEIFGSQDEARKLSILQALQGISQQFRQILLITHVEDVKESLPYVLNVKENSNNTITIEVEGK